MPLFVTPSSAKSCDIISLHRYAIKGLSGDALQKVDIRRSGDTFPDDRRFALLFDKKIDKWSSAGFNTNTLSNGVVVDDAKEPWLHKENFLCAFTQPDLFATLQSSYSIVDDTYGNQNVQRLLDLRYRKTGKFVFDPPLLNMELESDRKRLEAFLSNYSQEKVTCVTSKRNKHPEEHLHQFGNTSSGYKQRNRDTRTVHIINQSTVDDVSRATQMTLHPLRFRPNVIIQGPPAWSEFDWIGKSLVEPKSGLVMTVISKTVRCKGVSIDPINDPNIVLDIPKILSKKFPQYGPYLGVYAVIDNPGSLAVGDSLLLPD